ncbi:MAG: PAS domain S-box protein [Lutibacter sp.]|nr:PAS domain S-box protein [Lutibacter sp.]
MRAQLKYIQKTLSFISKNGYETDQIKFLKSTAVFLAELFGIDFVLIDKYSIKSPNIAETVVLFGNECFIKNISYNLENTPCDTIINKKLCSYPANVKHIFPKDDFLRQNNIESYIGKPLWNSKKEPIGLVALMDTKPKSLIKEKNIAIVLDIIGLKIEEVLEKMLYENQLNLKIEELNSLKEIAEKKEQKLIEAQQIANLGHWELDIVNNKLTWSDEVFRIFEMQPKELEASEELFMKLVHPDDVAKLEKAYFDSIENQKLYEVKYRLLFGSRKIKHILGKGHFIFNDKGEPIFSIGTILDITSQIKIQNELIKTKESAEKNEKKYRQLSNLIFEGIVISEEDGVVLECNDVFLKMFGYSRKEIIGKSIILLLFPEKYHEQIRTNRNKKHTLPFEIEGIKKDGTLFPVEIEARNIDLGNNKINRLVTFRDLSSRKKAQIENKKLITAIEQSANTVVITDIYGNIEYTNPKFTEISGYTASEALGKNPRILKSGAQPKEYYAQMWETISSGKNWKGQFKNKTKSGKLYWEQVTITPIKDETGKNLSYLAIKEDITKNKEAEEKLSQAIKETAKSEKKFRELFEKSGDAILIIKNGYFIDCNQAAIDMLGYKYFEDVLNSHPSKLSPKLQPDGSTSFEKAEELIKITLEKGTHRFEWWHTKSNGELFPVEVLLTAIENEPNNKKIHCVWRDITHRKHAENELKDAYETIKDRENFVSKIIETANEGFWLIDGKANTIDLNAEMCKILGYSETSVKGKSIFDFVDEKNSEIFKNQLEIRKIGESSAYEIELRNANGKNVPCLFKTSPIFNNQNKVSGSFALVSDITNIKETLHKVEIQNIKLSKLSNELSEKNRLLLDSKDRFINLFEQNPVPLWEQDFSKVIKLLNEKKAETDDLKTYLDEYPDFVSACISNIKILNVNKAALALLGVKNVEELKIHLGKTNNKKALEVLKRELVSISSNKKTFSDETELVGKDGSPILALIKSVIIDDYGTSIASVIDVTAERNATNELQKAKEIAEKSENNLNEAQKIANMGSYELDFSSGIWKSSQVLDKIFGIDELYDRDVKGWLGIIHPDDLEMMEQYFERNIITNKEEFNKEYRITRKSDKQTRWVHGLGKLEFDNQGNLKSMIGTIQDISEKRQILNDLIIAKDKAEESDRLKTEFIQNMSHEIRTPMNGILGFSELLENPDLAAEKRKLFIDIIKNSTHQLLHIIDDIMEISVLETKQIKAEENLVCINELLNELFTVFNIKATQKNIELVLKNGLSNEESTILTDKNKLNKVLSNLLENALKFTDEGFVELGYKIDKESEPAQLEIYVKDSGIGIKPEKQKLIFDRFSQAEKELSKKVGGLGLGLSIAKENAELLGGKITVVSQLGEGAVFFVSIPYKPVNIISTSTLENVKTSEKNEKHTILIAEDEEVNFMVLETLLEDKLKLPCTIIHAKDGLEAVEISKTNPEIGLVLMDIKMPKMDGHEATKRIKEFHPNLPIIAQTAYSSPEEKEKAFLAGCDDFMSKPISKDVLKSMLGKYLLTDKKNGAT